MIYINPYLSVPINTIIGGVAGSVSTKAALATKLGISESIITRFQIVGSDVHAHISANYDIPDLCFNATSIVFYHDIGGRVINIGADSFVNSTIANIVMPNLNIIGIRAFQNVTTLTSINAPKVSIIKEGGLMNCINLTSFNSIHIEELGTNAMSNIKALPELINLVKPSVDCVRYMLYSSLNLPNITLLITSSRNFRNLPNLVTFFANNLTSVANKLDFCQGWSSCTLIEMKKLKVFGNASITGNAFNTLKTNCTIRVNIALATTNSGAPDAALVYAKTTRAAIVEFYDDAGNYVSTL